MNQLIMTRIESQILLFELVKTNRLVTKSMYKSFHQYIGTKRHNRSIQNLCFTDFEAKHISYPLTLDLILVLSVGPYYFQAINSQIFSMPKQPANILLQCLRINSILTIFGICCQPFQYNIPSIFFQSFFKYCSPIF